MTRNEKKPENERRSRPRPWIMAALALSLVTFWAALLGADHLFGAFPRDLDAAARIQPKPEPDRDDTARNERATILELVREHRRTTDDEWVRHLADTIYDESVEAEVDPLLIAAIVAKESSFKSRVVSHAGAVGLMQLRPFVAEEVADQIEVEWSGRQTLNSPALNVRLGIHYYKDLVDRFEGDEDKALTAYNYGPTRVRSQLRAGTYAGSRYANEILRLYRTLSSA